jgi:sugar phosphate isomerase/epimerase
MLIGTMNNPGKDVLEEIRWMAGAGMEFVDLTLEPPGAASWNADPEAIRTLLEERKLEVVGHTAFYLPIASAIEEIRQAAVAELRRSMSVFSAVGARWMNIHPDAFTPFHDRPFYIRRNLESLRELLPDSERYGVAMMLENLPGNFNSAAQLSDLLDPMPALGLHLDFGHANLSVARNTAAEILETFGGRLRHVHLHDNRGGHDDLHLPLGAGNIDMGEVVRSLKRCGYDGTITLEIFTPDRHFLAYSAERLRELWNAGGAGS